MLSLSVLLLLSAAFCGVSGVELTQTASVLVKPGESFSISCVSSDEIRLDQSPAVVKRPGETVKISCKIHGFDMTEYYMQPGKALEWLGQMDAGKNQPIYTETVKNQLTFTKDVSASLDL
ncbi:hypothetical protein KOW79_001878 [Hemibagrus wyckioides]|uniref:Uncharacterized protein n=1 Tax=Hemibagrus wyckioides TaxID=337641 RepID=A0A9D3PA68_9TELE|nr:hypothetical protein KOW79_001878 [Hemibagrus wyckioides]